MRKLHKTKNPMHYQSLIERLQKMYPINETANSKKCTSYQPEIPTKQTKQKSHGLSPRLRYTRPTPNFIKFISYRRRPTRSGKDVEFIIIILSDGAHKVGFGDRSANRSTLTNSGEKWAWSTSESVVGLGETMSSSGEWVEGRVRWAKRGDGNSYGDSGVPDIDEMEEKGVSGLEIGGVRNKSNPSA